MTPATRLAALPVLAALVVTAAPARAGESELRVEVSPSHLVLGADEGADVTVSVDTDGVVSEVELFSNVGTLGPATPAGENTFRARLEAPAAFYPHAAVIVAVAVVDGQRRAGFTTLPLWGQGALQASGEPGKQLVAVIGGRRYGPATAGEDGLASIPIQVAPGETEATAGGEKLPLGLVDFARVVGVSLERPLVAHPARAVDAELRFFVVDANGTAQRAPDLRLDVRRGEGSVGAPVVLAPGVVAARVRVPAGASSPLEVRWRLQGSAVSKGSLLVEVESAPPVMSELAGYGEGGDGAVLDLRVEAPEKLVLADAASVPVVVTLPEGSSASELRLYTNVGRVSSLRASAGGRYEGTFFPPPDTGPQVALLAVVADIGGAPHLGLGRIALYGKQRVRVRAKARSQVTLEVAGERFGPVKADRRGNARVPVVVPPGVDFATHDGKRVALARAPFARLLVVPLAARVRADGESEVALRLYAMTPAGGAAAAAVLSLDVDRGALSALQPAGEGAFSARYRAPAQVGVARFVAALDGDTVSTTTLRLPLVARAHGSASADLARGKSPATATSDGVSALMPRPRESKLLLLGAHAGVASNFIALYAPLAAVDVTLQGAGLLEGGLLQLELGSLYQPGASRVTSGPLEGTTYSRHLVAIPVVVSGGWRLRFGDASIAAGLGAKADWVYSVVGDASEQFLSFGPMAQLAGAYRIGPGEIVVKARYSYGGLEGGLGAGTLLFGYAVEVF